MKKLSVFILISIMVIIAFDYKSKAIVLYKYPINFGVLLYKEDDEYIRSVKNELLKIENANKDTVKFEFYDAKDSQELQNSQIDELINKNVDVILLNLVDINKSKVAIDKIKASNIPVLFFNREPKTLEWIKSYNKALYIGTEACEAGNIQASMILEEIKQQIIRDANQNGSLDTIILNGEAENIEAQLRSECAIRALNENNIRTNIIANEYCNWEKECAMMKIDELFLKYGNTIDLIIANNDSMAIGAIMALQKYGYNTGDKEKYIPVVGVDGTDEAKNAIEKGFMTGTVIQNSEEMAKVLYTIGNNLVKGDPKLKGTLYNFDITGVGVRIPYNGYII
ncbi:galactose ABC transporter substrate-binding protein [Clostridium sp. AL.422]|uniref:galactose ABC transporter substrate-binding protein n=1 Tax=Clostridium TaxID=1485 RepID=UPI00293DD9EB|nr:MULTISPECIES: galactose ABC transporter substrate-binding protein [unclassified Clostridium]MDV4151727.1 galactose ABC transporter substrate-binding protein [Clostridium sp. AL.422]